MTQPDHADEGLNPINCSSFFLLVLLVVMAVLCGGAVRGCSNDFDRATGNPETFERWAW